MDNDIMDFDFPINQSSIIKVIGIGGGGNNAVTHMYEKGIKDVNFIICNTDLQALNNSPIPTKVQIGAGITEGLGAGSQPETGKKAADESIDDVMSVLSGNTKMVFITTGMGGGTGTGATPVIAKKCKEQGLLTIAIVTIPFKSEGKERINFAKAGINELQNQVDSLLIINNEKLREIYGNFGVSTAFAKADDILTIAVKGIAEIITKPGYINVDYADVETVMKNSGVAIMGMGSATGEDRALKAIQEALTSPLLNSNDITGAKSILLNIVSASGEKEITMDELGEITDYLYEKASDNALITRGLSFDDSLGDTISVTVIATGFKANNIFEPFKGETATKKVETLNINDSIVPKQIIPDDSANYSKPGNGSPIVIDLVQNQGVIDFDIKDDPSLSHDDFLTSEDHESNNSEMSKIKSINKIIKEEGLTAKNINKHIDILENIPAYKRRDIAITLPETDTAKEEDCEVSRYTLTIDEEQGPTLRNNNAYLNDNVD